MLRSLRKKHRCVNLRTIPVALTVDLRFAQKNSIRTKGGIQTNAKIISYFRTSNTNRRYFHSAHHRLSPSATNTPPRQTGTNKTQGGRILLSERRLRRPKIRIWKRRLCEQKANGTSVKRRLERESLRDAFLAFFQRDTILFSPWSGRASVRCPSPLKWVEFPAFFW